MYYSVHVHEFSAYCLSLPVTLAANMANCCHRYTGGSNSLEKKKESNPNNNLKSSWNHSALKYVSSLHVLTPSGNKSWSNRPGWQIIIL